MKTAEEWMSQISGLNEPELLVVNRVAIREIQLDAMKEGMRRAATIAEGETFAIGGIRTVWETAYEQGCNDCEKAILSAAEQLTEKDLCSVPHVTNPSNQKE